MHCIWSVFPLIYYHKYAFSRMNSQNNILMLNHIWKCFLLPSLFTLVIALTFALWQHRETNLLNTEIVNYKHIMRRLSLICHFYLQSTKKYKWFMLYLSQHSEIILLLILGKWNFNTIVECVFNMMKAILI